MDQTRFNVKKANGEYITEDELYDMAKELIVDELDNMDTDEALELGNCIRDNKNYDTLYRNDRENINEQLEDEEPYDILNLGWDDYSDFFTWDGDLNMTDDVWYDLDTDEIAEDILDGSYKNYIPSDIEDIIDDYQEASEFLRHLNPHREEGKELLAKFTNCEADVTDLLQYIDKLVRNDDVWED